MDLAEARLAPTAAEGPVAWVGQKAEAAVQEQAVAEAAVQEEAVAEVAGEDVEGKQTIEEKTMRTKLHIMTCSKIWLIVFAIFLSGLGLVLSAAPTVKSGLAAAPQSKQKEFATPQEAVDSLLQAAGTFDVSALKEILGPDSADLITSEDPVMDKDRGVAFAAKAKEKNSVEIDKQNPNHATLIVGNDDFPLPIPIVKQKGRWFFDTKAGRKEILNRRVGENELNAIGICRGFAEAQHEYAQEKHDDSKVNQYAQKIISTPGKHDGLAWQNPDGSWGGPVGETVAKALEQGYSNPDQPQPYHGYYFKVLKAQGPDAPLGQMDFVVKGAMIGGFALAAAPAQYRVTGVQTFIVGPNGVVYQKDLGPDTLKIFKTMDRYNPDKTWKVTEDDVQKEGSEPQAQ